jgi:DNA-binding transcriptional LysR family regulator
VLGEPLLLLSDGEGLADFLREALEVQGRSLIVGQTITRLESLVSLVLAGLGVGLISTPASAWLGRDQVQVLPLEDPAVSVPTAVGRLATQGHSPMVQRLFECLGRAE